MHESLVTLGKSLKDRLAAIEEGLIQPKVKDQMDTLAEPMQLSAKFAALAGTVASADAPPTRQARLLFDDLSARVAVLSRQLHEIIDADVATFNTRVHEANLSAIIPPVTGNGMSMAFESAESAIDPLTAYSRGDLSWRQAQQLVAAACNSAFARRLAWANKLQWMMFAQPFRGGLGAMALHYDWLWRLLFSRTR